MRRAVRQLVIFAVVAIMAFGNGLSFAAADTFVHHEGSHEVSGHHETSVPHAHKHNAADHSSHLNVASDHCIGADCDDSGHDNRPCCHTHVHCCTSHLSLAFVSTADDPILGKGALLVAARASLPLGTKSYPLLRPPRLDT